MLLVHIKWRNEEFNRAWEFDVKLVTTVNDLEGPGMDKIDALRGALGKEDHEVSLLPDVKHWPDDLLNAVEQDIQRERARREQEGGT